MKAMLLAAGAGRRMFPFTLLRPKPAIPVLGRPLLVQILHWLGRKGADQVVLNLHHLPDGIKAILGDGEYPGLPEVHYSHEEEILGTAGGIRHAGEMLRGDGPIVICNSDFLSDIDLAAALASHLRSGQLATLVLAAGRPGYTVVRRTGDGLVRSLGSASKSDGSQAEKEYLFTGCHIIEEELIDRIPPDGPSDIVRDVYRPLIEEGRLSSFVHPGFWWEFGSPELYLDGCLRLLGETAASLNRISTDHDTIRRLDQACAAVGPGAGFHESARFSGRATLGYSSYVSEGARIEDSVVMPEAWIGPKCDLKRSVIGQGVELPAGFACQDVMACQDADPTLELSSSTRREGGMLLYSFTGSDPG